VNSEKLHVFEILARQHEPMLFAYAISLIPEDRQLAEDVVQETFLIAYRKISTLQKEASFGPWLRGIARFEVYAALRKRGREVLFEPAVLEGMEDVFGGLEEQNAMDRWQDRFQLVEDCFQALPERLRQVCQLHYFEDRNTGDAARFLRIALSAVLKRLERARNAIRDCVEKRLKLEDV
jgi:RNA polymerase sigma factor (sigma-70 family)